MNTTIIGRTCAAAVITLIGVAGATAPASANDAAPSCDPVAVQASLTQAEADARAAQKAFTTHTKTSMKALVKRVRTTEKAEARAAAKQAKALASAARKDPSLRDAAKVAQAVAKAEAKEAARAQRASYATLKRQVRVDRAVLKAQWDAAKVTLEGARQLAEDCPLAPPVTPTPEVEAPA